MDSTEFFRILIIAILCGACSCLFIKIRLLSQDYDNLVKSIQNLTRVSTEANVRANCCATYQEVQTMVDDSHERTKRILRNEEPA